MSLTYETSGKLAIIQWDDGKANAVNPVLIGEMNAYLDEANAKADALVIAGRPGVFCGGFDLKILRDGSEQDIEDMIDGGGDLAARLFSYSKPVVMACTGHAIAQGAAFLMAADLRVGGTGDFKLGLNETQIDMVLRHFGPTLAKARLSKRYWTRAAILGELFSPEDAVEVGYLDYVTDPDDVIEAAISHARLFAQLPPQAFAQNKLLMRREAIEALATKVPL